MTKGNLLIAYYLAKPRSTLEIWRLTGKARRLHIILLESLNQLIVSLDE